jgi:hypothetical protein
VSGVLVSADIGNIPAGLGGATRTYLAFICVRRISRRCSCASSPKPGPVRGDRDELSNLFCTFPRRLSVGRGGEVSVTPIEQVVN